MTLFSLFVTLTAFAVSANAVAPLISTLSGSLGVKASNFGYFITLQFIAFSLASFVGGYVKERLRLTNYHLVASGLVIIAAAFFLGTVGLRSAAALVVWVIPLGLAGGAVETFSSIQISTLSRPGSSKNLCLSQVFYSIGAFASPQLVYLLFGAGLGWKTAFLLFGLFSAAICAFFLAFHARGGRFAQPGRREAAAAQVSRSRGPTFYFLLLLMLFGVTLESLSAAWLSYIFELRYGLTAQNAALALVIFWSGMILGRFSIVLLPTRWTLWPALLAASLGILATTTCLAAVSLLPVRYALGGVLGFFVGPLWPVNVMTSSTTFGSEKMTSTIIGMGAIGFASGPLLGSLLLRFGLAPRFFQLQLALGALILAFCLASRLSRARVKKT